jgi:hypothetical protein
VEWTVLPLPPFSHDLAPSNSRLSGLLKDAILGQCFAEDDELKHGLREELRRFSIEFYAAGIQRLMQRRKTVSRMKENLWKNSLNFVTNAPIMYVNVITFCEKIRSFSFVPTFVS